MRVMARRKPLPTLHSTEFGALVRVGPRHRVEVAVPPAERRGNSADGWRTLRPREILEQLPADSTTWVWLREHGARRPSPSGPSGPGTPSPSPASRTWRRVELHLEPTVVTALDELAQRRGEDRHEVVTGLISAARARLRTS